MTDTIDTTRYPWITTVPGGALLDWSGWSNGLAEAESRNQNLIDTFRDTFTIAEVVEHYESYGWEAWVVGKEVYAQPFDGIIFRSRILKPGEYRTIKGEIKERETWPTE